MKSFSLSGKTRLGEQTVPLMLFWVVLLSYGLFLGWFGFYGDDWSYVWYHHLLGWNGPGVFAALDRPLSAGFYNPVITLLGENALFYHILNLILRWLGAVLFFKCIKLLWKDKTRMAAVAAALFAVYPGFTQQPIAVEFILHFAVLDLFFLSLLAMSHAQRRGKIGFLLTLVNMIMSASMFWLEYFVGLELLRPVFLWAALQGKGLPFWRRVGRTLVGWIPNLLVLAGFLIWRVFIFTFNQSYKPNLIPALLSAPLATLASLAKNIAGDFKTVLVDGWRNTLNIPTGQALPVFLGLVGVALVSLLIYFHFLRDKNGDETNPDGPVFKDWAWQPLLLGLCAMLAAGWVFWITGIAVEASFPWDRTTLSFMPGVSLFIAGLLELLLRPRWQMIMAAVLISLAVGFHYQNALVYKAEWQNTRAFYWQLSWRAPGIQPGTLVASDDIPLYRISDAGLNAPLNWTYAPGLTTHALPYRFFDLTIRMGSEYGGMPGVKPGLEIKNSYRSLSFRGKTEDTLVFDYKLPACVHFLSPQDETLPGLPQKVKDIIHLSNFKRIVVDQNPASVPPPVMFPEPAHEWCYYYQKASLALQEGNWSKVSSLGKEAEGSGLKPKDPAELLPFIQGYAGALDLEKAKALSSEVNASEAHRPALCGLWKQLIADAAGNIDQLKKTQSIALELGCADQP